MLIVENDDCTLEFWNIVHPDYGTVAQLPKGQDDEVKERQLALAKVFAVAPKLLTACRAVVERWESGDLAEAVRMCAAAVAEAEGRAT